MSGRGYGSVCVYVCVPRSPALVCLKHKAEDETCGHFSFADTVYNNNRAVLPELPVYLISAKYLLGLSCAPQLKCQRLFGFLDCKKTHEPETVRFKMLVLFKLDHLNLSPK